MEAQTRGGFALRQWFSTPGDQLFICECEESPQARNSRGAGKPARCHAFSSRLFNLSSTTHRNNREAKTCSLPFFRRFPRKTICFLNFFEQPFALEMGELKFWLILISNICMAIWE